MPDPRPNSETKKQFVARCMGDAEAVRDYPNASQRYAVCNSKWNRKKAREIVDGVSERVPALKGFVEIVFKSLLED